MGLSKRPSLGAYFLRRLTRIEPPYLIALGIYALAASAKLAEGLQLGPYLAAIFYLKNAIYRDYPWPFFVSWSLEVEVQFYLLAPLFSTIFLIPSATARRLVLLAATALAGIYAANARLAGAEAPPYGGPLQHGWTLAPELVFFLTGMLAADFWVRPVRLRISPLPNWFWDAVWIAGLALAVLSYAALPASRLGLGLLPLGLLMMCISTFWSGVIRAILQQPLIAAVGCACYTIYLFHSLVLSVIGRFMLGFITGDYPRDMLLLAIPSAILITLITLIGFPIVERPFMFRDWPQMLWSALRGRSLTPLAPLFAPPKPKTDR